MDLQWSVHICEDFLEASVVIMKMLTSVFTLIPQEVGWWAMRNNGHHSVNTDSIAGSNSMDCKCLEKTIEIC